MVCIKKEPVVHPFTMYYFTNLNIQVLVPSYGEGQLLYSGNISYITQF